MDNQQLWQAILGELELSVSKAIFTTWFKNTFISEIRDHETIIGVPNTFTSTWLEKKYYKDILKLLDKFTSGQIKKISFRVENIRPEFKNIFQQVLKKTEDSAPTENFIAAAENKETKEAADRFGLNPRHTFKNMVVGKGNEVAYAAALGVAKNPGQNYNPFFVYGGPGLGKTHLMQAIGHEVLSHTPTAKILYASCEKFTNDYIEAVQKGKGQVEKFRQKYRAIDVLMIDDIQFLAGKEGTKEEFFHTFNDLHQKNKQLIISSDRPPKAIPTLEERITSRFECGLITDITPPDLEMRTAILRLKSMEKGLILDDKILEHIATNVHNNVRELEGALNRVIAYSQIHNARPTIDDIKSIISSLSSTGGKKKSITVKELLNTICEFFDISLSNLVGPCREKKLVGPRQITMYLLREELNFSYPGIGAELGGRDHTTAMHACEKIKKEVDNNEQLRQDINFIRQKLYG